jgi:hypothetical protein
MMAGMENNGMTTDYERRSLLMSLQRFDVIDNNIGSNLVEEAIALSWSMFLERGLHSWEYISDCSKIQTNFQCLVFPRSNPIRYWGSSRSCLTASLLESQWIFRGSIWPSHRKINEITSSSRGRLLVHVNFSRSVLIRDIHTLFWFALRS